MDIEKIIAQVTERVIAELQGKPSAAQSQGKTVSPLEVPARLEHSMVNPDMSLEKIIEGCMMAKKYGIGAVVVTPYFVPAAKAYLKDTGVKVCAPVGFPHAAASLAAKLAEIRECIQNGADELDVSLNISAIKSGNIDDARKDLEAMVDAGNGRVTMKAIYEQGIYSPAERQNALTLIRKAGTEYVKISNALGKGRLACVEDIEYVKSIVGRGTGIKIDGGVKTLEKALELFNAGADRIGLSATEAVAQEALKQK